MCAVALAVPATGAPAHAHHIRSVVIQHVKAMGRERVPYDHLPCGIVSTLSHYTL